MYIPFAKVLMRFLLLRTLTLTEARVPLISLDAGYATPTKPPIIHTLTLHSMRLEQVPCIFILPVLAIAWLPHKDSIYHNMMQIPWH